MKVHFPPIKLKRSRVQVLSNQRMIVNTFSFHFFTSEYHVNDQFKLSWMNTFYETEQISYAFLHHFITANQVYKWAYVSCVYL